MIPGLLLGRAVRGVGHMLRGQLLLLHHQTLLEVRVRLVSEKNNQK